LELSKALLFSRPSLGERPKRPSLSDATLATILKANVDEAGNKCDENIHRGGGSEGGDGGLHGNEVAGGVAKDSTVERNVDGGGGSSDGAVDNIDFVVSGDVEAVAVVRDSAVDEPARGATTTAASPFSASLLEHLVDRYIYMVQCVWAADFNARIRYFCQFGLFLSTAGLRRRRRWRRWRRARRGCARRCATCSGRVSAGAPVEGF
jgi:hypothetical protein